MQPRDHHRAHYETEGSRGAIKAACGGHPVVKVKCAFIAFGRDILAVTNQIRANNNVVHGM